MLPLFKKFFSEDVTNWLIPGTAIILGIFLVAVYYYGGPIGQHLFSGILVGFAAIGAYEFPGINQIANGASKLVYGKK